MLSTNYFKQISCKQHQCDNNQQKSTIKKENLRNIAGNFTQELLMFMYIFLKFNKILEILFIMSFKSPTGLKIVIYLKCEPQHNSPLYIAV